MAQPPGLADVLPRMDVAVLVGFAAKGPVHTPVLVEESGQYSDIFGADLALAWDAERGVVVYAYLAAAVRAFFRNGGRRCWIVRVPHQGPHGHFDPTAFVDCQLVDAGTMSLMAQADFLRYQKDDHSLVLKGIHAALDVEEATLIAVPDAVHRGWSLFEPRKLPPAEESPPPVRPEWWRFLDCDPPPQLPAVREPPYGNFLKCPLRLLPAPRLEVFKAPSDPLSPPAALCSPPEGWDAGGRNEVNPADPRDNLALTWTEVNEPGVVYVLEESPRPNFAGARAIYRGAEPCFHVRGRAEGDYYYRVRAEVDSDVSDWSSGVAVRIGAAPRFLLDPIGSYRPEPLLALHKALLRLCAARGDLFAILALPEHYAPAQAAEHAEALRADFEGQSAPLSYGALYHPWLIGREESRPQELRHVPPDGALSGILAQRARLRGAWIAPANETLAGVAALSRPVSRHHWQDLWDAQVNLVRQEPRGFTILSADTLSGPDGIRPINVRRLLMLLRRLALKLGVRYAFEPNDRVLRRRAQRGFEAVLDYLFARGAFAGRDPADAYRVVTDATVNPPANVDLGRFVVELRVRPALPMSFVTIRLVQTGERGLVIEER